MLPAKRVWFDTRRCTVCARQADTESQWLVVEVHDDSANYTERGGARLLLHGTQQLLTWMAWGCSTLAPPCTPSCPRPLSPASATHRLTCQHNRHTHRATATYAHIHSPRHC